MKKDLVQINKILKISRNMVLDSYITRLVASTIEPVWLLNY